MNASTQPPVRPAAVAGTFYPALPDVLRRTVDDLLTAAAQPRPPDLASVAAASPALGRPKVLIVPHAGYVYSGPIAASAYRLLSNAASDIQRVVLLGPAHRVYVPGIAAAGAASFDTPLGAVACDNAWLSRVSGDAIVQSPRAHAPEHCLEVQLPFLQRLLPHARIVPLLVSDAAPGLVGPALEQLWGGPETLIVISSDLSHYLPYAQAQQVDADTARHILALDPNLDGEQACGCAAVNGALWVARRKQLVPRLLDLRSSGDTAGSRREVVGYAAFALYESDGLAP